MQFLALAGCYLDYLQVFNQAFFPFLCSILHFPLYHTYVDCFSLQLYGPVRIIMIILVLCILRFCMQIILNCVISIFTPVQYTSSFVTPSVFILHIHMCIQSQSSMYDQPSHYYLLFVFFFFFKCSCHSLRLCFAC